MDSDVVFKGSVPWPLSCPEYSGEVVTSICRRAAAVTLQRDL